MTLRHTFHDVGTVDASNSTDAATGSAVFVDEVGWRRRWMVVLGRVSVVVLLVVTGTVVTALTWGARMSLPDLPGVLAGPAERVLDRLVDRPEPGRANQPRTVGGGTGQADGGAVVSVGTAARAAGSSGTPPRARGVVPETPSSAVPPLSGAARGQAQPGPQPGAPVPDPPPERGPESAPPAGTGNQPTAPTGPGNRSAAPSVADNRSAAPTGAANRPTTPPGAQNRPTATTREKRSGHPRPPMAQAAAPAGRRPKPPAGQEVGRRAGPQRPAAAPSTPGRPGAVTYSSNTVVANLGTRR